MARILVVEDDKDISSLIALALKNAGYEVNAAYDGEMGADFLEKDSYDVVLLDIMLPNIDGYELFSYIKEYSVPVIFITAKGEISDKAKAFHIAVSIISISTGSTTSAKPMISVTKSIFSRATSVWSNGQKRSSSSCPRT